jgi:predicted GTPase
MRSAAAYMRRVDSVEAENRKTAKELLQAADLCLFVTTGQRGMVHTDSKSTFHTFG